MNPFAKYRRIKADDIIRSNIRSNHIAEDTTSLLNTLLPITYIANSESQKADSLHRNVIQKLRPKPHTLELLELLGYEVNQNGDYVYRRVTSKDEIEFREEAADEIQRFYSDLKKIKAGSLHGFQEYISKPAGRAQRHEEHIDDDYIAPEKPRAHVISHANTLPESGPTSPRMPRRHVQDEHHRSSSQPNIRPKSPPRRMPDYYTVQGDNQRTTEVVRTFKETIKPRHEGAVAHSFIRRRLLNCLFKQKYPNAIEFGENEVDAEVDRRIKNLKEDNRVSRIVCTPEVYYECLIRSNFEHDQACEMLRHNRPNLEPPRVIHQEETTTTLDNARRSIEEHWNALNENANENDGEQVLLHAGDEWKNTAHVIASIIRLRKEFNGQQNDNRIVNKMYRLIFSELSRIIGPQSVLKIEILSNALCESPIDSIELLGMADIRDIILFCGDQQISDSFQRNTTQSLAMECPTCLCSFPRSRMETMFLCEHRGCIDCVKMFYRGAIAELRDAASLKKLTCFLETHELVDDAKLNFFNWLGTKLNQWFTDERRVLDLYHENLYIATRDSSDKKCGNPQCAGFFYNNNNRIGSARCPHCQFEQCQQCCRRWYPEHADRSCDQYAEWLLENDPNDPQVQLLNYLNTAGMICPNEKCRAVFEYKPGGCEHFTCTTCKVEFCRICSAYFYNPKHNTVCPRPNCSLRDTVHAHCCFNCFREIRDASNDEIIELLTANGVNVTEELRKKPQATGLECPVEGCTRAAVVTSENRFCEVCYKQFLCLFVWRRQIEPWTLYSEGNLTQKLKNVGVTVPANTQKPALIALARQHLSTYLGQPQKIDRRILQ